MFDVSVHTLEPGFFATALASRPTYAHNVQAQWERASPSVRATYGRAFLDRTFDWFLDVSEQQANPKLDLVVDAYFHAANARRPQVNYLVGQDAHWVFRPLSLLPVAAQYWVKRLVYRELFNMRPACMQKTA